MSFSFLLTFVEFEYWTTLKGFLGRQHKVEHEGKQCPCHGRVSECIYNVQGAAHDILISYQPEVIWGGCPTSKAFKNNLSTVQSVEAVGRSMPNVTGTAALVQPRNVIDLQSYQWFHFLIFPAYPSPLLLRPSNSPLVPFPQQR